MGARHRWPAFALSLIGHFSAISFLLWLDTEFQTSTPLSYYKVLVIPKPPDEKHIVWYNARKSLPDVDPVEQFGSSTKPQSENRATETLIVRLPDPISKRQAILQPEPVPIPTDVPLPNQVVIKAEEVPPVRRLAPKTFVPPSEVPAKRAMIPTVAEAPVNTLGVGLPVPNEVGILPSSVKLPPKPFVAPPRSGTGANAPIQDASGIAAPAIGSQSAPGMLANLQAVFVGLDPAAGIPPPGSRGAEISRAPVTGPSSSGALSPRNPVVPGVLSRGSPSAPPAGAGPDPVAPAPAVRTRREIVLPGVNRTMSAALRPSSRILPASVEAHFSNRNVYTLVIAGPRLPGYSGDWVMWFAERQTGTEARATILAPLPAAKNSSAELDAGPAGTAGTTGTTVIQFAGVIDQRGRVASAKVVRGATDAELSRKMIEELETWEFKPAMRNGEPMEVDVVIEIPFLLRRPQQTDR